jgi:hypothetical protein
MMIQNDKKGDTMPINAARRQAKKESAKKDSVKKELAQKKRRATSLKSKGQGKHNQKSDYQQHIREKKLAEGARAKDGCAPKLFMLLLPLIAVGAYLVLRS